MCEDSINYFDKKVLLIGGGGTIGTYVANELLEKGSSVDIICLEDYISYNPKLRYFKSNVTTDFLKGFLADKFYDAVLNFLHYPVPEDYIQHHMLIAPKTAQEVFFSSIRAVGDAQHPITEEAPLILDLIEKGEFTDPVFIERYDYSLPKARCERYLKQVSKYKNWTIVRPMISSSDKRLDIIQYTFHEVIEYAMQEKTMYLPLICKDSIAGLEWAGNTGRLIANLLFKEKCLGETYMISTGHSMTWETVANVYKELLNLKTEWIPTEEYISKTSKGGFPLYYDRGYDRRVNNSKVMRDSGLTEDDLTPFKEGIKSELIKLNSL